MNPILFDANASSWGSFGIGVLSSAIRCEVEENRNGSYELEMEYPVTGNHYSEIQLRRLIVAKPNYTDDPQPFRIYAISKPLNGIVTVNAQHISYDLSGYVDAAFNAVGIQAALSKMVNADTIYPTNCPFRISTDISSTSGMQTYHPASVRSLMGGIRGSLIDVYGGEWHFDGYDCTLHGSRGANRGVVIRYGKNLTDLRQEENNAAVYTAVYPYYYNQDADVLVTLTEKVVQVSGQYNYTNVLSLDLSEDFQSEPTQAQLREKAQQYISNNKIGVPKVNLTIGFQELEGLDKRVDLCDLVSVYFAELGVSATAKCIRTKWDVLKGRYIEAELGSEKSSLAETIANTSEIQDAVRRGSSQLAAIAMNVANKVTGNRGGYIVLHDTNGDETPDEILIMNTPDIATATKVIRFNNGGIAFSKTGYGGTYSTAWNIDGEFVANFIASGELQTDRVKILGDSQFCWDDANIEMINPSNTNQVIRFGKYDGTHYGLGFSTDGGRTWKSGFDFSGIKVIGDTANTGTATMDGTKFDIVNSSSASICHIGAGTVYNSNGSAVAGTYYRLGTYKRLSSSSAADHGDYSFSAGASNAPTGVYSNAIGYNNSSTGSYSNALGYNNTASNTAASAMGYSNTASGASAAALGRECTAGGSYGLAGGYKSSAGGTGAVALGYTNTASGTAASALGYTNTSSGNYSVTAGYNNEANKEAAVAIGYSSKATGTSATALGRANTASGNYSMAEGYSSTANQEAAVALGYTCTASGAGATALGRESTAGGSYALASGYKGTASGTGAVALGHTNTSSGNYSVSAGYNNEANKEAAIAMGYTCKATGISSTALGRESTASGDYGFAGGYIGTASGTGAVSLGYTCTASGNYSVAEGYTCNATDEGAIAIGLTSNATGKSSIALGHGAKALAWDSIAIGAACHSESIGSIAIGDSKATADYTLSIGSDNEATGFNAMAIGNSCEATNNSSVAFGDGCESSAIRSYAIGYNCEATDRDSYAIGEYCLAKGSYTAIGKCNTGNQTGTSYALIVGGGSAPSSRKDAMVIKNNGDTTIAGTLTQNSDQRLKTIVGEVPDLSAIRAVRFQWNDNKYQHDDKEHIGYIAQEVEKVAPYLVEEDSEGYKTLDYIALLCAKVDYLERTVARLTERIERLEAREFEQTNDNR